jgi:aminocarboxymuconate-semialdehyde decarboxylase
MIDPYGPTAARERGRPGRETRPKTTTIDMHNHVWSNEAAEFVKPHFDPSMVQITRGATEQTKAVQAKQAADRRIYQTDYKLRLGEMDKMGIDMQVISAVPGQMYPQLPLDVVVKSTAIVNDNLAAFAANRPDRFAAIGVVPLPDGKAAAEELERGMTKLGFKGVQVPTNFNGKELSDPAHEPFWAKAEELGAVVFIHPSGFTQPDRFARHYLNNTIGNPLETTIAVHYLIYDGVLERYPNLKIVAAHGGAFAAAYSGRMDQAWGAREDAHGQLPNPPTSYLRKMYFDSLVFTPHQLEYLVRTFGADKIMIGTDFPADMGEYEPLEHIASVGSFDQSTIEAVAGGNAKRLFNLG